jgi:hypothetical protein
MRLMTENDVGDELAALRSEVDRLRALVGPSENDYRKLQLNLLGARDAAIAAEAEVGVQRGRNQLLETELARAQRDFLWLRERVVARAKMLRNRGPAVGRAVGRLTSR